jgi:AraC family transcriptional regulator
MQTPQILDKPSFTVVGIKIRTNNVDNTVPQLWTRFSRRMDEISQLSTPIVAYGLMDNYDEGSGEFDYMAAFGVSDVADLPAGMQSWTIPAQSYAVFACTMTTIRATYDAVYGEWLPASPYRHAHSPEFEMYDETFEIGDLNSQFYIYIPVEKV